MLKKNIVTILSTTTHVAYDVNQHLVFYVLSSIYHSVTMDMDSDQGLLKDPPVLVLFA